MKLRINGKALRKALKWSGWGLGGLVALVLLACAAVQTPWAKRAGADAVAGALERELGWKAEIAEIDGVLPFTLGVGSLRLADAQGVWLEVEGLSVSVRPWPFGQGAATVQARVKRLDLARAPLLPPDQGPPPEPSRPLAFLDGLAPIPVSARADVQIESFSLGEALAGRALSGRLGLDASAQGGAASARLDCELAGDAPSRAALEAALDPLSRSAKLRLAFEEAPGGVAASMAGLGDAGALALTLAGEGPLSDWKASLSLTLGGGEAVGGTLGARLGASSADDAAFSLALKAAPALLPVPVGARPLLGASPSLAFSGVMSSRGLPGVQWRVLVESLAVDAAAASVKISGDTGPMGLAPRLRFEARTQGRQGTGLPPALSAAPLAVEGGLDADVDPAGPLKAALRLSSRDLGAALAPLGVELGGEAQVALDATGNVKSQDFSATLSATLEKLVAGKAGLGQGLGRALGSRAQLRLSGALAGGREARLSSLEFVCGGASLDASGSADLDTLALTARAEARLPDLSAFSLLAGKTLGGSATASVTASGAAAAPKVELGVSALKLAVDETRLESAGVELSAAPSGDALKGKLAAKAQRQGAALAVSTGFALKGSRLQLEGLRASGPGLDASADIDADTAAATASGALKASADLARLGAFLGQKMAGRATLDVKLAAKGPRQDVSASVTASGVSASGATLSRAGVECALTDVLAKPAGTLSARAEGLRSGQTAVERAELKASGNGREASFTVSAKGALPERFETALEGVFAPAPGGGRLTLTRLDASAYRSRLALTRPATASFAPGQIGLEGLTLTLDKATVTASGRLASGRVQATARVESFPLSLLEKAGLPALTGQASAGLDVSGAARAPVVSARVKVEGVRLPGRTGPGVPALSLEAGADISGGNLAASCTASAGPDATFDLAAALPVRLSLEPFAFQVPAGAALQASLKGGVDLAQAAALSGDESLSLKGLLKADFAVSGRVDAPQLSGRAFLEGGEAAYALTGTFLRDIALDVRAQGAQVTLERLFVRDAGQGSLTVTGKADATPGAGMPFEAAARVDRLTPVRMDLATATLSADVGVKGGAQGAKVSGSVHVGPVEVNLPDSVPPDATPIEVQRAGAKPQAQAAEQGGGAFRTELDVAVDFPGRVFVRGLGLDSMWAGALKVRGYADEPEIEGGIRIVRGQLDFFGKSFNLARGEVTFHGNKPPVPMLDMEAQTQAGDITASILVTGPAARPAIEFTSDPSVPRDEILARVLFGQSLSSLTPPQAIQLASAVAALSGKGGSLDVLGKTRKLTGLDYLGMKSSGQSAGQSSVAAGKYIADGVYVEASQGLGGQSGAVSVEVDVTKNISVESRMGLDSKTGVGVNWKFDY